VNPTPNNVQNQDDTYKSSEITDNILDQDFLEKLSNRFKGRNFLILEMSNIFLDQAPVVQKIIEEFEQNPDFEKIRFEAHKFKSTVNIIGLDSLRDLAGKTESAYHSGEPEFDTSSLLQDFLDQLKSDVSMVKRIVDSLQAKSEN